MCNLLSCFKREREKKRERWYLKLKNKDNTNAKNLILEKELKYWKKNLKCGEDG